MWRLETLNPIVSCKNEYLGSQNNVLLYSDHKKIKSILWKLISL